MKVSPKSDPRVRHFKLVRSISCLGTHPAIFRSFRLSKPTSVLRNLFDLTSMKKKLPPTGTVRKVRPKRPSLFSGISGHTRKKKNGTRSWKLCRHNRFFSPLHLSNEKWDKVCTKKLVPKPGPKATRIVTGVLPETLES